MINNEILSFVKEQTAQGTTKDQIKEMLVTQGGWDDKDVEEAFETVHFPDKSYPSAVKNMMADMGKSEGMNKPLESPPISLPLANSSKMESTPQSARSPLLPHIDVSRNMTPSSDIASFSSKREKEGSSFPVQPPVVVTTPFPPPITSGVFTEDKKNFAPNPASPLRVIQNSVSTSPLPGTEVLSQQPIMVFPKTSFNANPHFSPTLAQQATAFQQEKKKGGRFLLGLMMFLVGLGIGGISMNVYMNGYNVSELSGVVDKVIDLIGLGSSSPELQVPSPEVNPDSRAFQAS